MGNLILCHPKKATSPYVITRIHRNIYTIEELCYYLCNNLYLIDYTIMNESICRWIGNELEMEELSKVLLSCIESQGSIEQFVLYVLEYAKIYSPMELTQMQKVLEKLQNQKDVERQKSKADNLLESKAIEPAILVYQSILHGDHDESVGDDFYGRVYANLGAAYGRSFLYEEAAKMYEMGYRICEDEAMLKAYIYACSMYMQPGEYRELLDKCAPYQKIGEELEDQKDELMKNGLGEVDVDEIEEWKMQYRK